jgi:outer membrane protein assembly factor BamD (BamD/ComL family)
MIPSLQRYGSRVSGMSPPGRLLVPVSWTITVVLCALLTGCRSGGGGSLLPWSLSARESTSEKEQRSIDGVAGPLQRMMQARQDQQLPRNERDRLDRERLQTAHELFDAKEYAAASKSFAAIADQRVPKKFGLFKINRDKGDRPFIDPIREEALFYLPKAVETYQALVKDYPSSRYLDQTTRRLFDVSKRWLKLEDFATAGEIRQVSVDDPESRDQPLSEVAPEKRRFAWLPNLTDETRPALDTPGRAIDALKTIWLNDPSGPLADDALMLASTWHLRTENYQEADRLLTILREQFPKSTHLQTAFVLGSHVKLMSYQGADYDEEQLEEARKLKESTLRLFPDAPESDRIRKELKAIHEARAKRLWETAMFYEKKRKPRSVGVYLRELLREFPDSTYAAPAREKLKELGDAALPETPPDPAGTSRGPDFKSFLPDRPLMPFRSQPADDDSEAGSPQETGEEPVFNSQPSGDEPPVFDEEPATPAPRVLTPPSGRPAREAGPAPLTEKPVGRARL